MSHESWGGFGTILKSVQRKFGELSQLSEEQKIAKAEKQAALDNVIAFVSADVQTTKAEFRSGKRTNSIELQKEKPGSIFRLTWQLRGSATVLNGAGPDVYSWFVVGKDSKSCSHIYEIFQKSTNRVPQQGGELRLPMDDVDIYKLKLQPAEFAVDDTLQTLFGIPGEYGQVVRMDRMWGGTPEPRKKIDTKRVFMPSGKLVPIPQDVEI